MITAIVLVKADVARIPETAEIIAQIPQVSEVYSVTGEFDLVALVRVRAHEELADVIPGTLNRVAGVSTPRRTSRSAPTRGTIWKPRSRWATRRTEPPAAGWPPPSDPAGPAPRRCPPRRPRGRTPRREPCPAPRPRAPRPRRPARQLAFSNTVSRTGPGCAGQHRAGHRRVVLLVAAAQAARLGAGQAQRGGVERGPAHRAVMHHPHRGGGHRGQLVQSVVAVEHQG